MSETNPNPNHRFDAEALSGLPVDWEQLKKQFAHWREELLGNLKGKLAAGEINAEEFQERANDALRMVQERWKDLEENYGVYAKRLTQKIERHPVAAAAIALGVGFVAAKLLRRR